MAFKKHKRGAEIPFSNQFCLLCEQLSSEQALVILLKGLAALSVLQVPQSGTAAASQGHWRRLLAAQLSSQVKPHQQLYSVHWGPCSDPAFNTTHPPNSLCGCAVGFFLLNSKGVTLLSFSEGRVWRALYQSCFNYKVFSLCTGGKIL